MICVNITFLKKTLPDFPDGVFNYTGFLISVLNSDVLFNLSLPTK